MKSITEIFVTILVITLIAIPLLIATPFIWLMEIIDPKRKLREEEFQELMRVISTTENEL